MFTLALLSPENLLGRVRKLGSAYARDSRTIDRVVSPIRRPLDRAWYAHSGRLDELARLGDSAVDHATSARGKRVLVLTLRMWANHAAYEAVIAQALRLRGAEVTMLVCGGGQPICEIGWGRRNAPRPCDRCGYFTERAARSGHFQVLRLADEFPWGARPALAPAEVDTGRSLSSPDAALASKAWFIRSLDIEHTPNGPAVAGDFEISIVAVEEAFAQILDRVRPDVVVALNGLFAAERAVRAVAADRGVRVVTHEMAPRKDALVFGDAATAPEMVMDELAADQCSRPLTVREAEAIDSYLAARVGGSGAHERYFETQNHSAEAVRASLGIPPATRVVSVFTNLSWDTALFGSEIGFESQFDWLAKTAEIARGRRDTTLVVRIHPAETRWGSGQPAEAELTRRLGELPRNVVVVRPEDPLSTYGLLEISDLALCYTTTVGLEAAVRGVSVAVAAKTHYRGRGFTTDIDSPVDLARVIGEPPTMTAEQIELARRYAFAFFFRRMIPFTLVRTVEGRLAPLPTSAEELLPGRDPYLDFICDRVLNGGDFILPSSLALPRAA